MDPLDPIGKILEETKVEASGGRIGISFSSKLVALWVIGVTVAIAVIATVGLHQLETVSEKMTTIIGQLEKMTSWMSSADLTIRYNTARGDLLDKEHTEENAAPGEAHSHLPLRQRPPDCKEVRPGEPCLLR